ncbi:1-phosphofructokinase [Anaerocolumna xylanovorans]|uniref:Tagatose-6-phosphate kinase n=1 Tax=Anaerocolumna xylanovorans DSM 12503 TaxID=1121345 RepID=A0A1M7YD79_9FIRM|nr:1-phosphofructokinase [Anaerocolumna xylanovorans]SHO50594.1 fructose-1-phosphate kinase [Anaerocolumna xylanovorans DSM 12503]
MIYTVTFNPAIDYVVHMEELKLNMVNRCNSEAVYFGGKGINVSTVLKNLGIESVALGFIAGFTGKAIEDGLQRAGIRTDFITLHNGISRINVKIKSGKETEINGRGPEVEEEELKLLFEKLNYIQDGDVLVLAGNIPSTLPSDVYESIIASLQEKKIEVVVDATGNLLKNVLKYHPFLIKPNKQELGEIFHTALNTIEDIITYAKKLQELGARNVLISMAGDGAVLITETGQEFTIGVAKGTVKNSVGAGDSMVAGFLASYLKEKDYEKALKMGTAAGSATAFSEGLATLEAVEQLLKTI